MRLVLLIAGLVACHEPATELDPPDPVLPDQGLFSVIRFSWDMVDCDAEPRPRSWLEEVFVATPDDRMHLFWGAGWHIREVRCPIGPDGAFSCPTQEYQQGDPDQGFVYAVQSTLTGRVLSPTRLQIDEHQFAECFGERCGPRPICETVEHTVLVWERLN